MRGLRRVLIARTGSAGSIRPVLFSTILTRKDKDRATDVAAQANNRAPGSRVARFVCATRIHCATNTGTTADPHLPAGARSDPVAHPESHTNAHGHADPRANADPDVPGAGGNALAYREPHIKPA